MAATRVAKKIIKPILFIIGIALIIAFALFWVAAIISLFFGQPYLAFLFPDQMAIANLGIFSLFLMVGLPLLSVIFFLSRVLFATRVSPFLKRGSMILSIFAWVGFFAAASVLASDFAAGKNVEISNTTIENDVLEIVTDRTLQGLGDGLIKIKDGDFELFTNDDQLFTQNTQLIFNKSEDKNISVSQKVYTRGRNTQEVEELATSINYTLGLTGNKLTIPTHFNILEGTKYRGQKVIIEVNVPEGKSVRLEKNVLDLSYRFRTENVPPSIDICPTMTMRKNGFMCPGVEEIPTENKSETI